MLTPASRMRVRAAFPKERGVYPCLVGPAPNLVYDLYQTFGPHGDSRHWEDAEAFLEMLDVAAASPGNTSRSVVDRLVQQVWRAPYPRPSIDELANAARRLLAAECSSFVVDADPVEMERWAPYKRWAGKFNAGDAIVSFNYDLVVEMAREASGFDVIQEAVPPNIHADEGDVCLLKLHGSVGWRSTGNGIETSKERDLALKCDEKELVIASPGPTKQKTVGEILSDLWAMAIERIAKAEVIIFVGYRFPPSDAEARRRLFTALTRNQQVDNLFLRIVLGPDTTHENVLRLKGILEYAMAGARRYSTDRDAPRNSKRYTLKVHPLGAEDFLDVFEEGHLNQIGF